MKLKKYSIYALSMAAMIGLWSCSADEAMPGDAPVASGETVPVTLTVSRDDVATRTELSENTEVGGLNQMWSVGDEVKLYNSAGAEAGTLTLQSGVGTAEGIFTGTVTGTSGKYHLWYFGKPKAGVDADASTAERYPYLDFSEGGKVKFNFSEQHFKSVDDLEAVDIMSNDVDIIVKGDKGYVEKRVVLNPHVAMARFTISGLPAGVSGTVKVYNDLNNDRGGIFSRFTYNLSSGQKTGGNGTTTYFSFNEIKNGDDLYLAFLPNPYTLRFELEATNGQKFFHVFGQNDLKAGIYYQTFNKTAGSETGTPTGIDVPMEIDDSDNPGNINNWGGTHGSLDGVPSFVFASANDDEAWYSNTRVVGEYCYKKTSTLRYNMISNGHLTSWIYGDGGEAKYYQWGRLLGFPSNVVYAGCTMLSFVMDERNIRYPFGMNAYTDVSLYYSQDMDSRPCYAYTNAWTNGMEKQQAINSSIIYLPGDDVDYLKSNLRNLSWAERSGNPCPDGYRIPDKKELEVFVPTKSFKNTLVEYKTINGVSYAVRWEKLNSTKVQVTTVKTDRKDLSASDAIFENANQLELEANGMLYSDSGSAYFATSFNGGYKTSYYWSSTMQNGAAWALKVSIYSRTGEVSINMEQVELTAGCCIIPIRDDKEKATGFQPWFPIGD